MAYQINAAHTGNLPNSVLKPPLKQSWALDLGGPVYYPLLAGDLVYAVMGHRDREYGSFLYAFNAHTGATVWGPIELGGPYWFAFIAYENGQLFALNPDSLLRAFDARTGIENWEVQLGDASLATAPPTPYKGRLYVALEGHVYALNEADGEIIWTAEVHGSGGSSPAVSDLGVFLSYTTQETYRLDLDTGAALWHYPQTTYGGEGRTPVLYEDHLYTRLGYLGESYVYDANIGTRTGTFKADFAPAFNGNAGFFLYNKTLRAIDQNTDRTLWTFTGDRALSTAPLIVNEVLYMGTANGTLYALNPSSGNVLFSTKLPASVAGPDEHSAPLPGMGAGRDALFISASNYLVAFTHDTVAAESITASLRSISNTLEMLTLLLRSFLFFGAGTS